MKKKIENSTKPAMISIEFNDRLLLYFISLLSGTILIDFPPSVMKVTVHCFVFISVSNVVAITMLQQIVKQSKGGSQSVRMTVKQPIIFQLIQKT